MKPRRRRKFSVEAALQAGGRGRIDLLRHCVQSVTMEPLFAFLVQEYRQRPRHAAAIALLFALRFCFPLKTMTTIVRRIPQIIGTEETRCRYTSATERCCNVLSARRPAPSRRRGRRRPA